jgi:WD40 repeat protein
VAVAPDGKSAVTAADDGSLRVWDVRTWRQIRHCNLARDPSVGVTFTPSGHVLITTNGQLRLWDPATGKDLPLPAQLADHPCQSLCLAPDTKTLLTAHEGKVSVWEWPAGRLLHTLEVPVLKHDGLLKGRSTSLSLSADGRMLATRSSWIHEQQIGRLTNMTVYGALDLWDVGSCQRLRRLRSDSVRDAVFTPDGRGLVLLTPGSFGRFGELKPGNDLRLHDLSTGHEGPCFTVAGSIGLVHALSFSPDGRTAAAAGHDGSALLFEAATGLLRRRLQGHRGVVSSLAFAPDGRRLVTSSFDGTGLVWDTSLAALPAKAAGDQGRLWAELASLEPEAATAALAVLAAAPDMAVAFLKERLRPAVLPDAATLDRLVAALVSTRFDERERASAQLDAFGDSIVAGLRERLAGVHALEGRRRIERLLKKHDPAQLSARALRELRAVEILEEIGTPQARRLLQALSQGAPQARLTREAQAAVKRLAK